MRLRTRQHQIAAGLAALGLTLGLAACSGDGDASSAGTDASDRLDNGDLSSISIGIHSGWDEGIAVSHLFTVMLEDEGYEVETGEAEAGLVYAGLAGGDYDVNFDMWLPSTHSDYLARYGDDLEQLGVWYDDAKLTIAVNEDAPIDSLTELAANADLFGNRLVGIESGSGLVTVTQNAVIPGYGLEGMQFVTSSTPAMLTELQAATDAGRDVAVTLWRPHWAYNAFPIKDLEDPDGLLGDAEGIHTITSTGFADEFPEVSAWLEAFRMDNELLYSLEDAMFGSYDGDDYGPVVEKWIADNKDYVDTLTR
ncbi:MAG: glycine betaine ABC transporter substrate-binding protein [Microbacterium sp.]|uniref:glycine betaine ABC transporter substrate-binding protein n=1 Tax=Microbacterium sp. TaxID=51671 RepID=UPI003F7D0936